ncbi:pleckstrin homology domain-containing family A member 6 isoform X1 [Scleropages formosus]|uniref:pleckstrin homology domain-containing family A member 6 isoform X1 n=3 Tax=Scleropages formosus TaxID=113540 RepID=UPI0010FA84C3|nr:pleckstrin homology domain-containing family A member 6 isoform X1 [Scleropages formosus]
MLKFRADRRVSQNDQNGTVGYPVIQSPLEDTRRLQKYTQSMALDMNGKAAGRGDANSNSFATVSDLSPESQLNGRAPRSSRKAATFGKRSNSMRRNPKAEISKQGWLYKQASNGMKQWNKRWFVLTDRCLFYYKDEKEEGVLGSLPLLGFRIRVVQSTDNISRKYAFKAYCIDAEEAGSNRSSAFCLQAEHAGIRTYYFSAETLEEQEDWVQAMSEAARMHIPPTERNNSEKIPPEGVNSVAAIKGAEHHQRGEGGGQRMDHREAGKQEDKYEINGGEPKEATVPNTPTTPDLDGRTRVPLPNGWGNHGAPQISSLHSQESQGQRENTVLRRGFVPRTQPERLAQRKSSMTQLQQWVNQRRSMAAQEDLRSPSRYYTVNRGVSADYCGVYGGGPPYMEEYPLYPPGVRPDSICSVSGGFDRLPARWAAEERRRSLRDGPLCGREPQWAVPPPTTPSGYYAQLESAQSSMRRLSMQPRSRSVPRSPCGSSPGPYSPGPHNFASPVRSPSARFDRGAPGRHREDPIYADPSIYGLRRSLSSPKYEYPGDRRSISQGIYHYKYPGSPSLHDKMEDILDVQLQRNLEYLDQQVTEGDHLIRMVTRMVENSSPKAKLYTQVPQFHDVYRDMNSTLRDNEIEKLLGRLCEQNRLLKDQEMVVQRLRIDKDSLEAALVITHQELEVYRSQPSVASKLQIKKETLQNQLINIRGELSQASSALTTTRMEFEALEDEVNVVHGDLWEQLNACGQNELLHRHIQKQFWRVQDVLEGLHKNNPSRGTDTSKQKVASGMSGSFSTNSPASPLSSVSLTSPLSPFSPISGSQGSPTKLAAMEDIGPPRPPLPKFYIPLESPPTIPPSVPPLPLENSTWLRSMGLLSGSPEEDYDEEESNRRQHKFSFRSDTSTGEKTSGGERQDLEQDRQANTNKVGVVPPRTKSPTEEEVSSYDPVYRRNGKVPNGISRERPKSAVFPAEVKSKMSVEEQNERIRRNQSSSMRDKRRSLNLSSTQQIDGFKSSNNYRVVRRRLTAHEVDIKDLEAAVRGEGVESPREEIARLRRLQVDPDHYNLDIGKQLSAPDKVLIPERYLDIEPDTPLSPEEEREKQKKVERIKTLIAKSNMQNMIPLLDGPAEGPTDPEQQLQEQEKRIEISCTLAAEASRRSRLLSAQCAPSPSASPTSLAPLPSADSSQIMKV